MKMVNLNQCCCIDCRKTVPLAHIGLATCERDDCRTRARCDAERELPVMHYRGFVVREVVIRAGALLAEIVLVGVDDAIPSDLDVVIPVAPRLLMPESQSMECLVYDVADEASGFIDSD